MLQTRIFPSHMMWWQIKSGGWKKPNKNKQSEINRDTKLGGWKKPNKNKQWEINRRSHAWYKYKVK